MLWGMRRARNLLVQARTTFRYEGLIALAKRVLSFISQRYFRYGTYYLYGYPLSNIDGLNESDFLPRTAEFSLKVVSTEDEARELEADGIDLQMWCSNGRERLESGAMAFCTVVGQEPANIMWVALNERAQTCIGERPFAVDYTHGEYCGSSWTHPKYRRLGLTKYATFKVVQTMRDMGKTSTRGAVLKRNRASVEASAMFGATRYGEGRYIKLLCWESWKQKPFQSEKGT
jgi:hypothetical protein